MYRGTLRLGQFFNGVTDIYSPKVTVDNLITGADHIEGMKPGFTLSSALVNDYVLTHTLRNGADSLNNLLMDVDLGSEIIDYVVLQTPSMSIDGGTLAQFSLI
jgi:hypothetical protein